jgi:UDP-glucose 4-epimerase
MMRTGQSDFFNLGTGHGYSVKQVVSTAERVTGRRVHVLMGKRRAGDPPRLVADNCKAARVLKWKPKHSDIENILKTAWAWHQTQPKGR